MYTDHLRYGTGQRAVPQMVSVHVYITEPLAVTTQRAAGVVSLDMCYQVLLVEDIADKCCIVYAEIPRDGEQAPLGCEQKQVAVQESCAKQPDIIETCLDKTSHLAYNTTWSFVQKACLFLVHSKYCSGCTLAGVVTRSNQLVAARKSSHDA